MLKRIIIAIIISAFLSWLYYAWHIEPNRITVDVHNVYLKRLPPALDGFRIVQISDFHMARYGSIEHQTVAAVKRLRPDMVVLTGDYVGGRFVSASPQRQAKFLRMLDDLYAPHGIWAIMGNNEDPYFIRVLQKGGVNPLDNTSRHIKVHGSGFWLVGVTDAGEIPDLTRAFVNLPPEEPIIMISHKPESASRLPQLKNRVGLALYGHTHGGQIRLPILDSIRRPVGKGIPFSGGFRISKTEAYINQGIGTNWIPLRFRCPPQVTLIIMKSKSPSENRKQESGNRKHRNILLY